MQPPKKYTFQQPKLKLWTEDWCQGTVLNLFAGKTRLNVDKEIRVDLSHDMDADYYMDSLTFLHGYEEYCDEKIDTVILDPPYNWRKAKEKYGNRMIGQYPILKNMIARLLEPGSRVITFGYDSVGMARSRGFRKIAICLVCHSGDHHDTICTVEELVTKDQTLWDF